jgi:sugar-specific transcriptional regulator TrmB
MNLNLAVENLGLNKKEGRVYLALLSLGKTTAYNVSIKSGLKKPTTYVILEQLVEKGFALKIPRDKKQLFVAESPQKCLAVMKKKLEFSENAMPELLAIKKQEGDKANVAYFDDIKGIKELYSKKLKIIKRENRTKEIVGFLGCVDGAPKELIDFWKEFNKERCKMGIEMRAIITDHPSNEKFIKNQKNLSLDLKVISSEKYNKHISIEVYDRFIQIVSFREVQGILIEGPDMAEALKQIFEMNWDLLSVKQIIIDKKVEKKEEEEEIKPDEEINIKISQIADL